MSKNVEKRTLEGRRKKEETVNSEIIVTDDAKILHQLAQQSLILVTQFDAIEKKLDKTIEILDKLLKLKKQHQIDRNK